MKQIRDEMEGLKGGDRFITRVTRTGVKCGNQYVMNWGCKKVNNK